MRGCVHVDFDSNQVVVLQLIVEDFAFVFDASDMDAAGLIFINKHSIIILFSMVPSKGPARTMASMQLEKMEFLTITDVCLLPVAIIPTAPFLKLH